MLPQLCPALCLLGLLSFALLCPLSPPLVQVPGCPPRLPQAPGQVQLGRAGTGQRQPAPGCRANDCWWQQRQLQPPAPPEPCCPRALLWWGRGRRRWWCVCWQRWQLLGWPAGHASLALTHAVDSVQPQTTSGTQQPGFDPGRGWGEAGPQHPEFESCRGRCTHPVHRPAEGRVRRPGAHQLEQQRRHRWVSPGLLG